MAELAKKQIIWLTFSSDRFIQKLTLIHQNAQFELLLTLEINLISLVLTIEFN